MDQKKIQPKREQKIKNLKKEREQKADGANKKQIAR